MKIKITSATPIASRFGVEVGNEYEVKAIRKDCYGRPRYAIEFSEEEEFVVFEHECEVIEDET